jgi:ubiquinone/menaquinone biosynthesis C-methylase UbiE
MIAQIFKKILPESIKHEIKHYISGLYLENENKQLETLENKISDISGLYLENENKQLETLENKISDLEVLSHQLLSILNREADIPPPPNKHLQVRVVGGYVPNFIESGFANVYPDLMRALKPAEKELSDFKSILDFGCGCGRAIRALATLLPESDLYGTDIDNEAIEWLTSNYSKYAEFSVAPHLPPTRYSDQKFDFVFGISVLTHLPEEMQFQWLKELNRITKTNGYVLLTTHGKKHYKNFDPKILNIMNTKGFFYSAPEFNYGKSISLPDFYQNAFHSHNYIRSEWSKYFNIVDIQTLGMENYQDIVLLQKR